MQFPIESIRDWNLLIVVLTAVLLAAIGLCLLTHFDRGRSHAWLRLDWFVPALRKLKANQVASHSLPGRWLRRIVPTSWQSNRTSKQRGAFRRMLRRFGLSWLASPVRRVVQASCLLLFCVLFFYVCWPYHATPVSAGHVTTGWNFRQIDQSTGEMTFAARVSAKEYQANDRVFLMEESSGAAAESQRIGEFIVSSASDSDVQLSFAGELSELQLDRLLTASGTFAFHQSDPFAWPAHYADNLAGKEFLPAELFLTLDPLVSLSTAIASRSWVWSLVSAAAILIVCVLIPRGFCGYLCPLGTTIDLFDWAIAGRTTRFRVAGDGWWVHIKYYLLAGTLIAALGGVLVSGFFSAIPIITRALLFLLDPLQSGAARGRHLVPEFNWGHLISIGMFLGVLGLGFLRPRFWCKYVCPSGAVFSLGNLFRATERKVESSCINCNKCVEICPFDAIKPDFTTRTTDCTLCQTCGGVCPTQAIKFVERWNRVELKVLDDPPTHETSLGRRGFLSLAAGGTAAVLGGVGVASATKIWGANLSDPHAFRPVRPPGSVPEREFLEMCIRCGECFKVCPNNVLQPEAFEQGLEGLWTPMVNADWAGCESSCNACGQVCPTGAIRALPLAEKRVARMGLAIVNEDTCLPMAGREACDLCVQECKAAGYHAIEYMQVGAEVDALGQPIEGTGYLAPVVLDDLCVGCGLCQTRCFAINVKERHVLSESAILVEAGGDREDRLMQGSYLELREQERLSRRNSGLKSDSYFIPEPDPAAAPASSDPNEDPFGINPSQDTDQAADNNPFGIGEL